MSKNAFLVTYSAPDLLALQRLNDYPESERLTYDQRRQMEEDMATELRREGFTVYFIELTCAQVQEFSRLTETPLHQAGSALAVLLGQNRLTRGAL